MGQIAVFSRGRRQVAPALQPAQGSKQPRDIPSAPNACGLYPPRVAAAWSCGHGGGFPAASVCVVWHGAARGGDLFVLRAQRAP